MDNELKKLYDEREDLESMVASVEDDQDVQCLQYELNELNEYIKKLENKNGAIV